MADAGLHMVLFAKWLDRRAKIMGGQSLADGANIVPLALDGEQRGATNCARVDLAALPFELAQRQRMVLKHQLHCFEIELGRQIQNGEIFVVEDLLHLRLFGLALRQMLEKLHMSFHVLFHVHRHEGR